MQELLSLLAAHGVLAVFAVTFAARVGAPMPAAPLLVMAGALGQAGQLSLWAAAGASLLANLAGDAIWFWGGRRWGYRVLSLLCKLSLSPDTCVRQSESLILRWGGHSLVAAKFVPGISVVAAPMAGALAMSWRRFIAFGLLAGAAWTFAFLGLGMVFSTQVAQVLDRLASGGMLAAAVLACALAAFVGWRWWRRHRFRRSLAVPRIGVDELRALLSADPAPVIVDVRSAATVQLDPRQIPGARNVEVSGIAALARELPAGVEVVLYCNCPNEASAASAALQLMDQCVLRARPLEGGLDAWFAGPLPALVAEPG